MLEDAGSVVARGGRALAEYQGHAVGFDASRGPGGQAAISGTMRRALAAAGASPDQIDCVSAAASGSVGCDREEARALAAVFAGRGDDLAVTAVKATLGEALGASGALQAAALIEAMEAGVLPGTPGVENVEEQYLIGKVRPTCRATRIRTALINSVGWDGHCCSLVLRSAQ
jgi:3-oxoacyl-(acyl-carrier-protein) synthase